MTRTALLASCLLLLVSCGSSSDPDESPAPIPGVTGRYGEETGTSPVGSIPDVVLTDSARNRDLRLTIEYPTRGGAHPVIIFSHGFGGSNRGYVGLSSYWASFGYVVIKPTHADSGRLRDLQAASDIWESQTANDWRERVRDVTFLIDSFDRIETEFPELKGKIDRNRVGVGGHSYGAHTAMLAGGARTFPGNTSYADPRVKAIVAMSPQGPSDTRGFTTESWRELRVPALFMTGSADTGVTESENADWRRQAYELSPAGDKWFVNIDGATHASFSGRMNEPSPEIRRQIDPYGNERRVMTRDRAQGAFLRQRTVFHSIRSLALAFWDTYLRSDQAAGKEFLERADQRDDVVVVHK